MSLSITQIAATRQGLASLFRRGRHWIVVNKCGYLIATAVVVRTWNGSKFSSCCITSLTITILHCGPAWHVYQDSQSSISLPCPSLFSKFPSSSVVHGAHYTVNKCRIQYQWFPTFFWPLKSPIPSSRTLLSLWWQATTCDRKKGGRGLLCVCNVWMAPCMMCINILHLLTSNDI